MATTAVFKTSLGTIKAKLFEQEAPETVKKLHRPGRRDEGVELGFEEGREAL